MTHFCSLCETFGRKFHCGGWQKVKIFKLLMVDLPIFASLVEFYHPALVRKNEIRFAVYCLRKNVNAAHKDYKF